MHKTRFAYYGGDIYMRSNVFGSMHNKDFDFRSGKPGDDEDNELDVKIVMMMMMMMMLMTIVLLAMANKGLHTNQSQFFITLQPSPWMDKRYVAFGKIIDGTQTLNKMEAVKTENERPINPVNNFSI
jgi:cyclophilin family peptidyl-prolyl cis-trans isomerase